MHTLVENAEHALVKAVAALPADVPNPGNGTAFPGADKFVTIMGWGKYIALGILVLALIGAGVKMALGNRHGGGGEHAGNIGYALGGVLVVSAAFTLVSFLAT